jgi:D-glycero-alpha-D-manno-heptose 1-phosphate guanylyltransferase
MALVAGRPFLTRLFDQLIESGVKKAVLCTGYMASTIRDELGDRYQDLEIMYSVEEAPLGTGGALRQACEIVSAENLLVLNGDSYCHCILADFIAGQTASRASAGMVLARVEDVARFGAVQINSDSRVESFIEKGIQTGPGWINAGVYLLPISRILALPSGQNVSLERDVIPYIIADGLFGYQCSGSFIDIGIPDEYQRAQLFFTEELKGKP